MTLTQGFDSNYRFIQVAAKRARQLLNGAKPQLDIDTRKPTKVAMEELKAGKIEWSIPEKAKSAVETAAEALEAAAVEPKAAE